MTTNGSIDIRVINMDDKIVQSDDQSDDEVTSTSAEAGETKVLAGIVLPRFSRSTMALNPYAIVDNNSGNIVSDADGVIPVYEDYNVDEKDAPYKLVEVNPSPTEIKELFKLAKYHNSPIALDQIPKGYKSYTIADVREMRKNEPDPAQQRLINAIYTERDSRLENAGYTELMDQIKEAKVELNTILPEQGEVIIDTKKTAILIDEMRQGRARFDGDVEDLPFKFRAIVGGETRFFELSMNQIENSDFKYADRYSEKDMQAIKTAALEVFPGVKAENAAISDMPVEFTAIADGTTQEFNLSLNQIRDHDFEGFHFWERYDINAIEQAGLKVFHEKMMGSEKYSTLVAQYKENVTELVGDRAGELPTDNFEKHFNSLDARAIQSGGFAREFWDMSKNIREMQAQAETMKDNVDSGVYLVKDANLAPDTTLVSGAEPPETAPLS